MFAKIVYEAQRYVYERFFPLVRDGNYKDIHRLISEIMNEEWYKNEFKRILRKDLFANGRRVHLICMLSALICEKDNAVSVLDIKSKLFERNDNDHGFDIEHIFARKNFENMDDDSKATLNGIGNLIVLERNINRSIKDKEPKDKSEEYKRSRYKIVEELRTNDQYRLESINAGNIDAVKIRENAEVKKFLSLCIFLDFYITKDERKLMYVRNR